MTGVLLPRDGMAAPSLGDASTAGVVPSLRLRRGEYHEFNARGALFLYLVPSAAVYRLEEISRAILDSLATERAVDEVVSELVSAGHAASDVHETLRDLIRVRAVQRVAAPIPAPRPDLPRKRIPLTTLVVNVTSKCNLACTYCYEYGEDKIVEQSTKPRFMTEAIAKQSVDFLFAESGELPRVNLTFFGGETLLNFKVLKTALAYAKQKGAEQGKTVATSLTTNATLLREEVIDWIVENNVGVTVSIDGDRGSQDAHRVFANGMGTYDTIRPNIEMLIKKHRRRPVGARVTLTKQNLDVVAIYRHLFDELGFYEVGFAPVTTSWKREYAIQDEGFFSMLGSFNTLAQEFLDHSLAGKRHGFSNVRDTLEEIHKGMSKAYPCGAGLGLMGVATDGDVALCHRFAGSATHSLGSVSGGVSHELQDDYLKRHHVDNKTDCSQCWARPLCAGGCYHEANTRYGSTEHANLHYCEWIRSWTHTCLEVYGALAERKPEYLAQFDS